MGIRGGGNGSRDPSMMPELCFAALCFDSDESQRHAGAGNDSAGEAAAAAEDVIEGDWTGAEKDQGEGNRGGGHGELVSGAIGRPHKSIVQMHFPDGDAEIDADSEGSGAGEESDDEQQPAEELCECRDIAQPRGKSHAADGMSEAMQSAENLVITVRGHDSAEHHTHHEKSQRLQTIEVAQIVLPGNGID
jgi:hypothetical protein